jgi:uncharacterized membrane protein YozB (DUF420 family)
VDLRFLPHLNAALNATSAVLLLLGFWSIKTGRQSAHKRFMLGAVTASGIFLVSYIVYHYSARITAFRGEGWSRPVYFTILISHTSLAIVALPLVIATVASAVRGKLERHRKLVRFTFPIWLYVSVTGVVVYAMLYHVFPTPPAQ